MSLHLKSHIPNWATMVTAATVKQSKNVFVTFTYVRMLIAIHTPLKAQTHSLPVTKVDGGGKVGRTTDRGREVGVKR